MGAYTIDLNAHRAARREAEAAGGILVPFGEHTYELPAELPAAVLTPLIEGDLDIAWLMKGAFDAYRTASVKGDQGTQDRMADLVIEGLLANPSLPVDVLKAIHAGLMELFAEQWTSFWGARPSLPDLAVLLKGLWRAYGVSLGEAFRSSVSSKSAGTTSNTTFNGSTASTPAASGLPQALRGS